MSGVPFQVEDTLPVGQHTKRRFLKAEDGLVCGILSHMAFETCEAQVLQGRKQFLGLAAGVLGLLFGRNTHCSSVAFWRFSA